MSGNVKCESSVSFPIKPPGQAKVWKVIEIKVPKSVTPIKFTIQEVPEDRYEDVVEYMCKYFIPDEPMCKCFNGIDDPEYVEDFRQFWKQIIKHGLTVAAFVENPDGGKPIIAAVNVLTLSLKEDNTELSTLKTKNAQNLVAILEDLSKKAKVYEKYGVDRYLAAFGLSVHPSYRGAALGAHLLNARTDIGREYKIPVTSTAFTSPISQKLAARCGFETVAEKNFNEYVDEKGNELLPGIETKTLKIMAKKLY
ncbi:arylalkylamine N-acetyltransferase-like 2 [Xylocopa sonorina]|uniref:arylalkylamine N-acetyltransferase-like 2 n=1 Tax=Xylocopa sonorina TaxID=1818115 RepID=UPI00403B3859